MTGFTKRSSLPYLLGVSGGSGSGKTYFAEALVKKLGAEVCEIVCQDNFYIDQSERFDRDGGAVNFDHPRSIDFELMANCLAELKRGRTTEIPIYDFVTHTRLREKIIVQPKPIIIVDGILIFHIGPVRDLFDHSIFFDTSEELRFQRRLDRDVRLRGRTPSGVRAQFESQVRPMHNQFVQPSKVYSRIVVKDPQEFEQVFQSTLELLHGSGKQDDG